MVRPDRPGKIFSGRGGAKRIELRINGLVQKAMRRIQIRVYQVVAIATPKDTGFAQSSWVPTIGQGDTSPPDMPRDIGERKSAAKKRRATHKSQAESLARSYQVEAGRTFLTNAVPYVQYLNQGSSAQAGNQFVERGILTALKSLGRL